MAKRFTLFNIPRSAGLGVFTGSIPLFGDQQSIVVNTKLIGVPEFIKATRVWDARMQKAAERGITKAVKFLLEETLKVTPKDTGTLRKSGDWEVKSGAGRAIQGIVFFDPVECPYAIYVHEDLTKYHKPPTMAKFLQRTQYKYRARIAKIIRDELAKV